jgi:hypothetical protein
MAMTIDKRIGSEFVYTCCSLCSGVKAFTSKLAKQRKAVLINFYFFLIKKISRNMNVLERV